MPILNWLTRDNDIHAAGRVPYRMLEEAPDRSWGDQDSGNILIQGDNLEALKALLPFYAGQVKCIYIDPPYNTRSAFKHYDDNLEHTKWLAMMWPRLDYCANCWQRTARSRCPLMTTRRTTSRSSWTKYSEEETSWLMCFGKRPTPERIERMYRPYMTI